MQIRGVKVNQRRKAFEVLGGGKRLMFPFTRLEPPPTTEDPLVKVFVVREKSA